MANIPDSLTLDQLSIGQRATVTGLTNRGADRARLLDLGILPGTNVEAELRSPLGDPTAYRVRGAVIALRCTQAQKIQIQLDPTEE